MYVCMYICYILHIFIFFWLSPISLLHMIHISGAGRSFYFILCSVSCQRCYFLTVYSSNTGGALSTPGPWHTSGLLILPYTDLCWPLFSRSHQSLLKWRFLWLLYLKHLSLPFSLPTLCCLFLHLTPDICSIYYLFIVKLEYQPCEDRSSPISPAPCVAYSIDCNTVNIRRIGSKLPWQQVSVHKCTSLGLDVRREPEGQAVPGRQESHSLSTAKDPPACFPMNAGSVEPLGCPCFIGHRCNCEKAKVVILGCHCLQSSKNVQAWYYLTLMLQHLREQFTQIKILGQYPQNGCGD